MGPVLDGIYTYMKNKGLATDKSVTYLHFLDPFPTNLSMGAALKEIDATKARGSSSWRTSGRITHGRRLPPALSSPSWPRWIRACSAAFSCPGHPRSA